MDSDTPTPKAWDGTPLQKANFYVSGRRLLFDQVKGARLFLTHGTLVSDRHGKQAVINVAHAQDLIDGTLPAGTITPLAPFDALKHCARGLQGKAGTPGHTRDKCDNPKRCDNPVVGVSVDCRGECNFERWPSSV